MWKKIFLSFISFVIGLHLFQLFFLHFDGKIQSHFFTHKFSPSYSQEVLLPNDFSLDKVFHQSFYFLGQGKQMTAFISKDGLYVLKLFNPMRPLQKRWYTQWKYWKRYSSLKWIKKEWFGKKQRLKKLFKRHKLAYELLKEETGLIFVHLSPSKQIHHFVLIFDANGKKMQIPLAYTPFVLQKKAELVPMYLNRLLQTGHREDAKKALKKLEDLLEKRLAVGITDRIQTMWNNYGFVDDMPIQIDVGRIRTIESLDVEEERIRILENFKAWVALHYVYL